MGGSGTFGIRLGMNYSSLQIELAGEQVIGKTANMYPLSANVILNLATRGRLIPYGTVGAGLLLTVPTNTIGDRSVSTLGIGFGGGARYFLTSSFGFRAEVKQYMTSVTNATESGSKLLIFQELVLGVVFLFH
jgi:opacity protein-like surface antigen